MSSSWKTTGYTVEAAGIEPVPASLCNPMMARGFRANPFQLRDVQPLKVLSLSFTIFHHFALVRERLGRALR